MDALHAELMAAFADELAENLAALRAALADADAGQPLDLREMSRRTHSLKGAARAVDLPATEAAAHEAEALLIAIERGERVADDAAIAALKTLVDAIEDGAAPAPAGVDTPATVRLAIGERHVERLGQSLHRLSTQAAEQEMLADALSDVDDALRTLLPLVERDARGEAPRRMRAAISALDRARRLQATLHGALDRSATELERDGEQLMLQPVAMLFEGHERMVRELAEQEGKSITLRLPDTEEEADRRVLSALREPVLHMLRNAVRHGIEPPTTRRSESKPQAGVIAVSARIVRGRLELEVRDDGRGLDDAAIARRARAAGLIGDGPALRGADLYTLLFEQGLSTAETLDEVAGRGIGLSVVADAARRLHGTATIAPAPGGGTMIRLSVPVSLSRQTLLLVEAGGLRVALPSAAVESVRTIDPADLDTDGARTLYLVDGVALPVAAIADRLGRTPAEAVAGATLPAVILRAGGRRCLLIADALLDVRTLLVGDPTAIAFDVPGIFGTVLVDGAILLVLDPEALVRDGVRRPIAVAKPVIAQRRRTILVVDDSITTRTLERSILEAQGYRVLVDVDGLAALERLRGGTDAVDLVVADVEMPRMDGFGLLAALRNDPAFRALPVVMMTSRNSPEDVERGLSLGASAYTTKQEFDQGALVEIVRQLI